MDAVNPQTGPSFASVGIRNTDIHVASGVRLSDHQKVLVGSVLDLFAGNPTLKHFTLWRSDATFQDPISKAQGFAKYTAQWYGLPALFHPITIKSHRIFSADNPIEMELSNMYTVKGVRSEKIIDSIVRIYVDEEGKIVMLEDKWNGKLPEGTIAETFRKLNAATVPSMVRVPETEEEDLKMQKERDTSKM